MVGLTGRTALVTGASRGIGRAIAQRSAADGSVLSRTVRLTRELALSLLLRTVG